MYIGKNNNFEHADLQNETLPVGLNDGPFRKEFGVIKVDLSVSLGKDEVGCLHGSITPRGMSVGGDLS